MSSSFNASTSFLGDRTPSVRKTVSRYSNRLSVDPMDSSHLSFDSSSLSFSSGRENTLLANQDAAMTAIEEGDEDASTFLNTTESSLIVKSDACTTLYQQFCEGQQKHPLDEDALTAIKEFEDICSDHLNILDQIKRQRSKQVSRFDMPVVSDDALKMLRLERNTWRLALLLMKDRLESSQVHHDGMEGVMTNEVLSDMQVVERLFERSESIRQMQLVVDWCEENFNEDCQTIESEDKIEFYSEGPHFWENTLHSLKTGPVGSRMRTDVVDTSLMDPDACFHVTKIGKGVHELDKEDESRVMRFVFRKIRSGQIFDGIELCSRMGYHWLAGILLSWTLHHDPNFDSDSAEVQYPNGNARRDLFKYSCWSASNTKNMTLYEKAIYASLSGNVSGMMPACPSWMDKLWAYFRASIDVQVEYELKTNQDKKPSTARVSGMLFPSGRVSVELPTQFWSNNKTPAEIFAEVEGILADYEWSSQEKQYFVVQKYLILNDYDRLLEAMIDYSSKTDEEIAFNQSFLQSTIREEVESRHQMLRFFAHIVLFLQSVGAIDSDIRKNYFNTIIEGYILFLIQQRYIHLVSFYVSKTPKDRHVFLYAKFLKNITDKSDRKRCLESARQFGLDVEEITTFVVEKMKETHNTLDASATATDSASMSNIFSSVETTEEDRELINGLDWLMLGGNYQYTEILRQSNSLIRSFLLNGKMDAAKDVKRKLPNDLIMGVMMAFKKKHGSTELSADLKNQEKEHICLCVLFDALESINDWMSYLNETKPQPPPRLTSNKFAEKIAHEQLTRTFDCELKKWKEFLALTASTTAAKITEVLTFPNGWMADTSPSASSRRDLDAGRSQEQSLIRRKFIPQLASILHTILHTSNLHSKAISIADMIADDKYRLFAEFEEDQLKDLLRKIQESSVAALTDGQDAFGYETSTQGSE